MGKLYKLSNKKELPPLVKDTLHEIAKAYIDVLDYTLVAMSSDDPSHEEMNELKDMVVQELMHALDVALFESTFKN